MTDTVDKNSFEYILEHDARWCHSLGIDSFADINQIIRTGKAIQFVNLCEARHENRLNTIAYRIKERRNVKVILIAGPSSSGKTSTSLRIALQCKVHRINPVTIELDNYFKNREETPLLPSGKPDYECLEAMDIDLLNRQLNDLIAGKEVELPRFDFIKGEKVFEGKKMRLAPDDVLILEGIHALNPGLTPFIPKEVKFHIYVSDISNLSHNNPAIHTTDNRLLRRMVRDVRSRGISPEKTIENWQNVREGENKYIFPYQGNADMVFNSTAQYELPLLKHYVLPSLKNVGENEAHYQEAQRLLKMLSDIDALPVDAINAIPCTSIMREFIGGQILSRELL